MDREIQDYYESLFEMFATQGWKEFIEDQAEALHHLKQFSHYDCKTNSKWQKRRGEIFQTEKLLNYERSIRNAYDNLEREAEIVVELSNEYDPLH